MIELNRYYYYDDFFKYSIFLAARYPDLLQVEVLGSSHDGRKIILLKFGKGDKNIICTGGVHGRESINPIVMMKMIEFYGEQYRADSTEATFFDKYTFYFIPLLNPDGYMIALRGFNVIRDESLRMAAKSQGISYQEWKYNARGIDLNRNFPSRSWRPKHLNDCAASENETKLLMRLFGRISSIGYIDYHSRGELIYYHRSQMSQEYNDIQQKIAKKIKKTTGYCLAEPVEEIEPGDSGGNTVHYYAEQICMPAITLETVPEEETFPLAIGFQADTFEKIRSSPFALLDN